MNLANSFKIDIVKEETSNIAFEFMLEYRTLYEENPQGFSTTFGLWT